jgi:hypothetical protein
MKHIEISWCYKYQNVNSSVQKEILRCNNYIHMETILLQTVFICMQSLLTSLSVLFKFLAYIRCFIKRNLFQ